MFDSLPSVLLAPQQYGVASSRRTESELIQGDGLATSIQNPLLGGPGELERGNGQLGNLEHADVVRDSADDDNNFRLVVRSVDSLFRDFG